MNEAPDSRRASPRVSCRWLVKCVTEQKKTFSTRAVNISQGGVQIFSPVAFKNGERLYMEISGYHSSETRIIKVVGTVAYVSVAGGDDMQLGLKFVSNLSIQDSRFIQQYVKAMLGG